MTVDTITEAVRALLVQDSQKGGLHVLLFGSCAKESDIDMCAITRSAVQYEQVRVGRLDLTIIPPEAAAALTVRRDILMCEVLSAGTVIIRDEAIAATLADSQKAGACLSEIVEHHFNQSLRARMMADAYLQAYRADTNSWELASRVLDSLAWCTSYFLAARCYRQRGGTAAIGYPQLLTEPGGDTLAAVRQARVRFRTGEPLTTQGLLAVRAFVDALLLGSPS